MRLREIRPQAKQQFLIFQVTIGHFQFRMKGIVSHSKFFSLGKEHNVGIVLKPRARFSLTPPTSCPFSKLLTPVHTYTHVSDFNSTISKEIVQKIACRWGDQVLLWKRTREEGYWTVFKYWLIKLFPPGFECGPIEKIVVSPPPTAHVVFGWSLREEAWNEKQKQTKRIGK